MVERTIAPLLKDLFRRYPFVTVTGPRQSGKTTLCRTALPELAYVNLESPEHRQFADDPKRFLSTWSGGVILDEIQRVPPLLSWLQVFADEHGGNGLFVLTGSGQFLLSDAIDQSLAGRTALLRLLPFSISASCEARASTPASTTCSSPGSTRASTIRDSIHGKRSATTSRRTSSATCAGCWKSGT